MINEHTSFRNKVGKFRLDSGNYHGVGCGVDLSDVTGGLVSDKGFEGIINILLTHNEWCAWMCKGREEQCSMAC